MNVFKRFTRIAIKPLHSISFQYIYHFLSLLFPFFSEMDVTTFDQLFPFNFYFSPDYNAIATNSQGITLISPHPSIQAARMHEQQLQQQQQQVQHQIQQQKQQQQHQVRFCRMTQEWMFLNFKCLSHRHWMSNIISMELRHSLCHPLIMWLMRHQIKVIRNKVRVFVVAQDSKICGLFNRVAREGRPCYNRHHLR